MPAITLPNLEIVVLTSAHEPDLSRSIRRLHAHVTDQLPPGWQLTIADQGSPDRTWSEAQRLVTQLEGVDAVRLPGRLDRKALRARWASSPATVVAFVELEPDVDLDVLLAPLAPLVARRPRQQTPDRPASPAADPGPTTGPIITTLMPRRAALATIGGLGLTALLAACGSGSSSSTGGTTAVSGSTSSGASTTTDAGTTATTTSASTATSVVLAPEMTEGPYYLDLNLVRSDITEDREGAPLALNLVVVDAGTGSPVEGAAVDIWHCDANGLYSGFVSQSADANSAADASDDGTFLRGTQLADSAGKVTFATIYPGWYRGRTVHIHVKVHVSGQEIHTGQLFFDDAFTDTVYASAEPYSSRSERETRNSSDSIYSGGGAESTLGVQASGGSYATTLTMGVATS